MAQPNEPDLSGITGTPSKGVKARLEGMAANLKTEGFVDAAAQLEGLLNETDDVIASHPRVITTVAAARPTPGGGDFPK